MIGKRGKKEGIIQKKHIFAFANKQKRQHFLPK